jgi:hypothetical protein
MHFTMKRKYHFVWVKKHMIDFFSRYLNRVLHSSRSNFRKIKNKLNFFLETQFSVCLTSVTLINVSTFLFKISIRLKSVNLLQRLLYFFLRLFLIILTHEKYLKTINNLKKSFLFWI